MTHIFNVVEAPPITITVQRYAFRTRQVKSGKLLIYPYLVFFYGRASAAFTATLYFPGEDDKMGRINFRYKRQLLPLPDPNH